MLGGGDVVSERTKRFDGPVVIVESYTDPGDMGEPREFWSDDDKADVLVVPMPSLWVHGLAAFDEPIIGEAAVQKALIEHDRDVRLGTLDILEEMLRQRDDVAWADEDATFQEIDRLRSALQENAK